MKVWSFSFRMAGERGQGSHGVAWDVSQDCIRSRYDCMCTTMCNGRVFACLTV